MVHVCIRPSQISLPSLPFPFPLLLPVSRIGQRWRTEMETKLRRIRAPWNCGKRAISLRDIYNDNLAHWTFAHVFASIVFLQTSFSVNYGHETNNSPTEREINAPSYQDLSQLLLNIYRWIIDQIGLIALSQWFSWKFKDSNLILPNQLHLLEFAFWI